MEPCYCRFTLKCYKNFLKIPENFDMLSGYPYILDLADVYWPKKEKYSPLPLTIYGLRLF